MDIVLRIAEIIALVSVAVLSLYLVVVLVRLRTLITSMEHQLKEVGSRAMPILSNLEFITDRLRNVAQQVEDQVDLVRGSLQAIKTAADEVLTLERKVHEKIETPIVEAASFLAAMYRGIRTFLDRINE